MSRKQNKEERHDIDTINIKDLITNVDSEIEQVEFHINDKKILIPFYQLIKYTGIMQEQYCDKQSVITGFSKRLTSLLNHNQIQEKSLTIFFQLIKEENVQITSDEYWDLLGLSKMFKADIFTKYLALYSKNHSKDVDFLLNMIEKYEEKTKNQQNSNFEESSNYFQNEILGNDQIAPQIEFELGQKINECLKREKFALLQFSTVFRIIEHAKKSESTSDLLFDFIMKSFNERFPLLMFVEIRNLSDSKFSQLYNDYLREKDDNKKKYSDYMKMDLLYINDMKEKKSELDNEIKKVRDENKKIENQKDEMNRKNCQFQIQINKLKAESEKLQIQNSELIQNNQQYKEKIEQLKIENEQLQTQNSQLNEKILENQNQIKILEQFKEENIKLKELNKSLKPIDDKYLYYQTEIIKVFLQNQETKITRVSPKFMKIYYIMRAKLEI